ncbi:sulfate ABC transporter substrate-binding protein [Sphingomonas aerolata]
MARSGQTRRPGDHAQPENQWRRTLELPRGLGLWEEGRGGSDAAAQAYVSQLYGHVPVLDSGARGATTTFVERGLGDVLIAWENEAFLSEKELGSGKFDIVVPSISVLAEPSVAVVDANAKAHGTEKVAEAYLRFLYTPEGQDIVAKNYYRPRDPAVLARYGDAVPADRDAHHSRFRRMEGRAGPLLCRRRRVRPDLFGSEALIGNAIVRIPTNG